MCTSCVLPIVTLRRLCPAKSHLCPRLEQTLSSSSSFIILTAELSEFGRKHSYFTMSPLQEMRQNHMYTVVLINSRRTISFLTNFCQVISYKSYKRGSSYYVFNQGGGWIKWCLCFCYVEAQFCDLGRNSKSRLYENEVQIKGLFYMTAFHSGVIESYERTRQDDKWFLLQIV